MEKNTFKLKNMKLPKPSQVVLTETDDSPEDPPMHASISSLALQPARPLHSRVYTAATAAKNAAKKGKRPTAPEALRSGLTMAQMRTLSHKADY